MPPHSAGALWALALPFRLALAVVLMSAAYYLYFAAAPNGPAEAAAVAVDPDKRLFTIAELTRYNDSDPSLPVYLAIVGDVFDVSAGREYYGASGGYHCFAGRCPPPPPEAGRKRKVTGW